MKAMARINATLLAAAVVTLGGSGTAAADFGPVDGTFRADVFDRSGELETQAGAHPYAATTAFEMELTTDRRSIDGYARSINVTLPAGFVGNPTAATRCAKADFNGIVARTGECPVASQVGITTVRQLIDGNVLLQIVPVYSVEPAPGVTAEFGFVVGTVPVRMTVGIAHDGEYKLRAELKDISQGLPTAGASLTLWGDPADPSHDAERGYWVPGFECARANVLNFPGVCPGRSVAGLNARKPFLTNPTSCRGPQTSYLDTNSWENSGTWRRAVYTTSVGVDGCDRLQFDPSMQTSIDTREPDAPTGLAVRLAFPQNDDPDGVATAQLRRATVTLPEGMSISPSSADGLVGCSDAALGLGSTEPAGCPNASKIGTLTARTPLLAEELTGGIYIRTQNSSDPRSGEMFRLALVLESKDRGVRMKLPGSIAVDDRTGRIQTTFDDNPQFPVSSIDLRFKSGPRAPLATPASCGPKTIEAEFTSWSGQTAHRQSTFTIDCTGVLPFAPSFEAGTVDPAGGVSSPFLVRVGRPDGQPFLDGLRLTLPPGLVGAIASVPVVCADARAQSGSCPVGARVGTATIASGPGITPFHLRGGVYLTGPYRGAPIGLAVAVRVVAGPFDLGTVIVRQGLLVDRNDAHVEVVSDALPTIVQGVPVRLRSLAVDIDRPGFMVNPTSCEQQRVTGVLHAQTGAAVPVASRFQSANCAALPFRPRVALRVGSRGRTRRDRTTPFSATLRMSPGQANNKSVRVTLPRALNSRLRIVNQACTLEAYRADDCGARARIGSAVAVTPLLRDPLRGSAYFVRNPARRLPDIMVALRGQVEFDLTGKVSIPRNLTLSTNFDLVPDVPITMFRLNLVAGRNGPIGAVQNLCAKRTRRRLLARLSIRAQSGRRVERRQRLRVAGCARSPRRRRAATRAAGGRHQPGAGTARRLRLRR